MDAWIAYTYIIIIIKSEPYTHKHNLLSLVVVVVLTLKKKNCVYICLMIGNNIYWRQCPWLFHLPAFSFFYIYPFNSKSSIQSNKSQSNFFFINMIHLYYTRLLYIHEIHSLVCVSVFFCNNILSSS